MLVKKMRSKKYAIRKEENHVGTSQRIEVVPFNHVECENTYLIVGCIPN